MLDWKKKKTCVIVVISTPTSGLLATTFYKSKIVVFCDNFGAHYNLQEYHMARQASKQIYC